MLATLIPDWWLLLRSLSSDIRFSEDPDYQVAVKKVDDFYPEHELDVATADLLLSFAKDKHSDTVSVLERLEEKRGWLFTVVLGLLTVGISAPKTLGVDHNWGVWIAYGLLLLAAVVLLFARRPILKAEKPTILDVHIGFDGLAAFDKWLMEHQQTRARRIELGGDAPEKTPTRVLAADWIARSLHKTCEGMRVTERIMSTQIWAVSLLVTISVLVLGPSLVFATPTPPSNPVEVGPPAAPAQIQKNAPHPVLPPLVDAVGVANGVTSLVSQVSANHLP